MENAELAVLFEKAVKEGNYDKIVRNYKDKIDAKAVSILSKAMYGLMIEQRKAEAVNEELAEQMKEYIVPRGKLEIPEYLDLIKSMGNIFKIYTDYKSEAIAKKTEKTIEKKEISPAAEPEGTKRKRWWEFWKA